MSQLNGIVFIYIKANAILMIQEAESRQTSMESNIFSQQSLFFKWHFVLQYWSFKMFQKGSFIPNEFNFHNTKSLAIVHVYNGEECYR
jgi:hypothetical protein